MQEHTQNYSIIDKLVVLGCNQHVINLDRDFILYVPKTVADNTLEACGITLEKFIEESAVFKLKFDRIDDEKGYIYNTEDLHTAKVAEKRFAFEEIFYIQLKNEFIRAEQSAEQSFVIEKSAEELASFTSRFPFALTEGQQKAINTILADFKTGHPMSRLLEGDVGSGKTAVAAVTTYATVASRPKGQDFGTLQVAYMAPTEILARQHFESFIQYFKHMPISIGLITGNGCRKFPSKINKDGWTDISRTQFLKWVASGEISVVIGTHALIQKSVDFKHLAYVIIDEQHRFGTAQRQKLTKKNYRKS
jgi:ATP-dependent DNA helicase RecG